MGTPQPQSRCIDSPLPLYVHPKCTQHQSSRCSSTNIGFAGLMVQICLPPAVLAVQAGRSCSSRSWWMIVKHAFCMAGEAGSR